MSLTLAHLSDVHLAPVPAFGLQHLNLKRALGGANWAFNRHKVHLRPVLDAVIADMRAAKPDHIIVSGDLCNLGLPVEHRAAAAWLAQLGSGKDVSVVPGNHDIYCRLWRDPGIERWRPYMVSIGMEIDSADSVQGFPYVRRIGQAAIVGVNSAIPTRPFSAIGQVGVRQLDALAVVLQQLQTQQLVRIVVIHHPPLAGMADHRHALIDAAALESILRDFGPELVLHGHNHRDMHIELNGPRGKTHVIGVGSASVGRPLAPKAGHEQPMARYNLIHIDDRDPHALTIETRGLLSADGPITVIGHRRLEITSNVAQPPENSL